MDNEITTTDEAFEAIYAAGRQHMQKTVEHVLRFVLCVQSLKDQCQVVSGGTDFTRRAHDAWGLSKDQCTQHLRIAKKAKSFLKFPNALPSAISTLEKLMEISDNDFDNFLDNGDIHARMTYRDATRLDGYLPYSKQRVKVDLRVDRKTPVPKRKPPETIPEFKKALKKADKRIAAQESAIAHIGKRHETWAKFFGEEYATFNTKLELLDERLADLLPDAEVAELLRYCNPEHAPPEAKEAAERASLIISRLRDNTARKNVTDITE